MPEHHQRSLRSGSGDISWNLPATPMPGVRVSGASPVDAIGADCCADVACVPDATTKRKNAASRSDAMAAAGTGRCGVDFGDVCDAECVQRRECLECRTPLQDLSPESRCPGWRVRDTKRSVATDAGQATQFK